ncbi:MAG: chorismate synthase [Bacteroidota bacterium]|nr:chorismate synthase [Bacteroidota bacterium]
MAGNSFGTIFKITTFGESHGPSIGVVIDGCPAGLNFDKDFINNELEKRRPGQSEISTSRKEEDKVEVLSGVFENKTTGTPIALLIKNKDQRSEDYEYLKDKYRFSHADFTYDKKYGFRDYRGGGRASARETVVRVAAGAIAKLILKENNISINAFVSKIGNVEIKKNIEELDFSKTYLNEVKCPDKTTAIKMLSLIKEVKSKGDSIGGIVSCVINNCPSGLGEPVFDKLEADLAKAMMSINASKAFEIGSGFNSATMNGSDHNDDFLLEKSKGKTTINNAGGILGGISTGHTINMNIAFKPTPTISKNMKLVDIKGKEIKVANFEGRHDSCIVPRAVAVVEAMAALVIVDHLLRNRSAKL